MSPIRLPIFHVLYTNAPGEDGQGGFRCLQVGFAGTAEDRKPIDEWLKGLEPAEGSRHGWATNSFKVSGVRCAALAVVNPSFSKDESSRGGGRLTHALTVPLEEGKPIGHFSRALYERAFSFLEESRSFSQSLKFYLEGCRVIDHIDIDEIRPDDLDRLFDLIPIVQTLIDAGKESASEIVLPGISDEEALPEKILAASALLPPILRLALRWRVGLQPVGDGFVVRPGRVGESPPAARSGLGQAYTDDLWRRLQGGQADELARIVNRSWEIRDWMLLPATAPIPQEQPAVQPPPELETEENVAKKKERPPGGAKSVSASVQRQTGKSAADYDQERQSLYDELEAYVNQRLQNLGVPPPPPARPRADLFGGVQAPDAETVGKLKGSWTEKLLYLRPEIYLVLALVFFVVTMYRKPQPTPAGGVEPASSISTDLSSSDLNTAAAPSVSPASTDPVAKWKSFVKDQPLVAAEWFQAVADHKGLEPQQVSSLQGGKFGGWAKDLKAGKSLNDADITSSLTGLFEYVHALWVKDNELGDLAKDDQVNLVPEEVVPHLQQLAESGELSDLRGSKKLLTADDLKALVADSRVQAMVVLRWIKGHPKSE